ncbi:MAG: hypothetical protein FWE13_04700 [Firmicutes bacterium]|nr:hypothetical protein [Bacillota bacterium]
MTIIFIRTPKVFITFNGNNLIITPKKGKEIIINPLEINYIGENKSYWRYGMVSSAGTITIQAKNELIKIHYVKDGTLVKHTLEKIRYSAYIMQQNQYHQQQSTNF